MNFYKKLQKLILCKKKKFLGFPPLKSKISKKLPLFTIFQIFLFIDSFFAIIYSAFGLILKGTFLFLAVINVIYLLINLIIFNYYHLIDYIVILSIYLIKFYLEFAFQMSYYVFRKFRLYLNYDAPNYHNLDLIIIVSKIIEDLGICYITWSLHRRARK